ncbi:MAG: hypothetical protein EA384_14990 [Spirochaetaceae bacterium]|nr:MAG: hypothetical protein EA384_14990 [Spirochaetaceae bacterium]
MVRRIALLLLLLLAPLLAAQARESWLIAQYADDLNEAQRELDRRLADNHVPVGLEVAEGSGISILYIDRPFAQRIGLTPDAARLVRLAADDMQAVEDRMNALMSDGWFPSDLSRSPEAFYLLFVRLPWQVEQWRFAYGMFSAERLQAAVELFQEDNMVLCGISLYEGVQMWYLFAESADWRPERHYFTSYANDNPAIIEGFNHDMGEGWIPVGFTVGTTAVTVHYVQ